MNKNYFFNKFIGILTKKGFKIKAKTILNSAFMLISRKTRLSNRRVLLKIFKKLSTFVEIKKIRVRKRIVYVPFYINYNRRMYLIIKWIMLAVKSDKRKIPLKNKIASEFMSILKNKSSKAIRSKKANISMVLSNRSNTHFRW